MFCFVTLLIFIITLLIFIAALLIAIVILLITIVALSIFIVAHLISIEVYLISIVLPYLISILAFLISIAVLLISIAALLKVIGEKRDLRFLSTKGLHGVTNKVIYRLSLASKQLESLNLRETSIGDEALFHLRNLTQLIDLNIAGTKVEPFLIVKELFIFEAVF